MIDIKQVLDTIIHGNTFEVLKEFPSQSVDYRIKQEYDYGRLQSYYCYHIKCYIERNPDEFLTLLEFLSEYLGDKEAVDRIVKCFKIKQLSEKIGRKENEC